MNDTVMILGTRGIPAQHGGFETFAEFLSLYLIKKDWNVTVYCQEDCGDEIWEDEWNGIRLVHIPVKREGALGTIIFDWKTTFHASRQEGLVLTLGYNTAIFSLLYRLRKKINLFNMDGLEWKRDKWTLGERVWLYLNERLGCWLGNHLVADHPEIKKHLLTRVKKEKVTMIPYGAEHVGQADIKQLVKYNLTAGKYSIVIARPEPENSILEIVKAFSARKRGQHLVLLGKYNPEEVGYHKMIIEAASDEVVFLGAIYDATIVKALRCYCRLYVHGHTVGGTNPSLIEALGAGSAVLAHDNKFNRWVAGEGSAYFTNLDDCSGKFDDLLDAPVLLNEMAAASLHQFNKQFTWQEVLGQYETLLKKWANG